MGFFKPKVINTYIQNPYDIEVNPPKIEFPKELTINQKQESNCTIPLAEYEKLKNDLEKYIKMTYDLKEFIDAFKLRDIYDRIEPTSVTINIDNDLDFSNRMFVITGKFKEGF